MFCPSNSWFCEYGLTLVFLLIFPFLGVVLYNFILSNIERYKKRKKMINVEGSAIKFYRMAFHDELNIEGATSEQVITYIKSNISTTLWYLHIDGKNAYDVDESRTEFFDPSKDKTIVYGIIFHGIKI